MNPTRALIVDDESLARERLRRMLAEIDAVKIVGEAENGMRAVEMIESLSPDLVLLDIQMPGLDGFEVSNSRRLGVFVITRSRGDKNNTSGVFLHQFSAQLEPNIIVSRALHRIILYRQVSFWLFTRYFHTSGNCCFEVIEALAEPPPIIFVTAYDEYAIRAFEVNALGYLLKPFSRERLEKAICRAQDALVGEYDPTARFGPLLENLAAQGRYLTRLAVYDRDHIRVLDAGEVDWIGIENEQVIVHVLNQAYPIRRTLTELEARLDPNFFFRAHRSAIVNLDRVRKIIPWFKGSHKLRLSTGAEIDLSRARACALQELLKW